MHGAVKRTLLGRGTKNHLVESVLLITAVLLIFLEII